MINTSVAFRRALEGDREFRIKDKITLKDGTEIQLSMENLREYKINEATSASGKFEIGAAVIKEYSITLDNTEQQYDGYDFEDANVQATVGLKLPDGTYEYLKKGTYRVYKASFGDSTLQIKAYDEMLFFSKPYSECTLTYPTTIQQIVHTACRDCEVTYDASSIEMGDYSVDTKPTGSLTYRDVISYCAQIMGCYARINHLGQLTFGWYDFSAIPSGRLNGGTLDTASESKYLSGDTASGGNFDDYTSGDAYDPGTFTDTDNYHHLYSLYSQDINAADINVTGIKISVSSSDTKESYLYGTDDYALEIKDNPLIRPGSLNIVAKHIGDKIINKPFRPIKIAIQSDPSIEAGDPAMITTRNLASFSTVITDTTFNLGGSQSVSCTAETPTEKIFTKYSATTKLLEKAKEDTRKVLSEYDLMVQQMNQLAANTFGFYFTAVQLEDGSYLYYKHDKPTLSESKVVYKSGIDGFFVTQNYTGDDSTTVWKAGFDSSGNAVLNQLAVTGLYWDWGVGGQLTLGGAGNGNGVLHVLNASGEKKVELSNCGQVFFNAEGKATATVSEDEFLWFLEPITLTTQETEFSAIMHNSKGVYKATGSIWKSNDDIATITWETDPDYVKVEGAAETDYDYPEPLYKNDKDHWFGKLYKLEAERSYFSYAPQIYNITQHTDGQNVTWNNDNQTLRRRSSSSKRYKDVGAVISLTDLEEWYKITPVWARYKEGYLSEEDSRYGKEFPMFIAEDVAEHFPLAADCLPDGRPETWNSFVMIPAMFAMIKEQHEQIERLKKLIEGGE